MGDYFYSGNSFAPPFALLNVVNNYDRHGSRHTEDRNPVYVNGDYIGEIRNLSYRSNCYKALNDYLKSRDIHDYVITSDGYEVYITSRDAGTAEHIKNNLNVYLNIN